MSNDYEFIMSGLDKIREGIILGDWNAVCDGFNSITGENLEPLDKPKKPKSNKEKAQELKDLFKTRSKSESKPKPKSKKNNKTKVDTDGEILIDESEVKDKRMKAKANYYGKKNPIIITTEIDEAEKEENRLLSKKKNKIGLAKKRITGPKDTSHLPVDTEAVRLHLNPAKTMGRGEN